MDEKPTETRITDLRGAAINFLMAQFEMAAGGYEELQSRVRENKTNIYEYQLKCNY